VFPVHLELVQYEGVNNQPIRFGIPFAPGAYPTDNNVSLWQDDQPLLHQFQVSSYWPDGSVRWLLADALPVSTEPLQLKNIASVSHNSSQWLLNVSANSVLLTSPALTEKSLRLSLKLQHTEILFATFATPEQIRSGPLLTEYCIEGQFPGLQIKVELYLVCYANGLLQIKTILHNPQRAKHTGGQWDLGDEGSVLFQGLELDFEWESGDDNLLINDESTLLQLSAPWSLAQIGSGGENWQSDNHTNAMRTPSVLQCGYRLEHSSLVKVGRRANPELRRINDIGCLDLTPCEFWQNFPSSLSTDGTTLRLGLFAPGQSYELQGGERKTQTCWLSLNGKPQGPLSWPNRPARVRISTDYYQQSYAMPWLNDSQQQDYDELLQPSLDGQRGFVAKREIIDEFGWRNFGDIFADHESLYLPSGSQPYISHYNNQYDPIYGFCRQYLRTGDGRWFQLMDELARHVSDIDIYHTEQDRAEYNHGLFWHTDHYLPAHTCTHRTYSKHNTTSSIPGQTGGGPANEHCYSSGLLYHFWLTGNLQSKQAVLELADWMINLHEGAPGLLSRLWSIKQREVPKIKALLKGGNASSYRYPFTRGTGNYLNTLLDAYELTAASRYLELAEQVLLDCIHPNDDIAARELDNIEVAWSYLVLLGVLPRYLRLKTIIRQQDKVFDLIAAAFYQYSRWLAEHEQPFLAKPELLEFPNDTWTAQDIRKVMLLRQAAQFFPKEASLFLQQAEHWYQWLHHKLLNSAELHFARVQVLLLLLHGPQQQDSAALALPELPICLEPAPRLNWGKLLWRITKTVGSGMIEFRLRRERNWLQNRINS
jgi:hypothetical protein